MNNSLHENFSKYKLAVGELYHPYFHGNDDSWDDNFKNLLFTSFLYCFPIEDDEMFNSSIYPDNETGPWGLTRERQWPDIEHPYIRNYIEIARPFKVDIVEVIELHTGHTLCIPKTFWLKIFQRKFKKYYLKLQERIRRAKNPRMLMKRSITGCIL